MLEAELLLAATCTYFTQKANSIIMHRGKWNSEYVVKQLSLHFKIDLL